MYTLPRSALPSFCFHGCAEIHKDACDGLVQNQTIPGGQGRLPASQNRPVVPPIRLRGILFDMDGVLYRGRRPLPGARRTLEALGRAGIPYALVTNNSTRSPRQYVGHLAGMGIRVPAHRIVTSSVGTAAYLRRTLRPRARVLVIGEPALRRAIVRAGFVPAWENVAAVVVGL
ncbi:MAG: hypothetical protein ACT4PY_09990, partial [Armatimonadota bacterium]